MLFSLALVLISGLVSGFCFQKIHLPSLVGMIVTGIILGPHVLDLLDETILLVSPDLRRIALIIILTRAGLSLDVRDLKKIGRPAFLMSFLPASFEMSAIILFAPSFIGLDRLDSALLASVLAAVSPAVVVPRMIGLMERGWGVDKNIPQLVMAGAGVDDVYVIVLFSSFLGLSSDGIFSFASLFRIPSSILLGIAGGVFCGYYLSRLFSCFHMRDSIKVIIILSISFFLVSLEDAVSGLVGFSGLIAVMVMGITLAKFLPIAARRLGMKYSKLWICSELLLFVLVGSCVDPKYMLLSGPSALGLIFISLLFRMGGVWISVSKSGLDPREKLFCSFAYIPKATVQAAMGSVPLSMGLSCGDTVLTMSVLAVLVTAPLGALLTDASCQRLLCKKE